MITGASVTSVHTYGGYIVERSHVDIGNRLMYELGELPFFNLSTKQKRKGNGKTRFFLGDITEISR
jgi:hypothetical protein